MAYVISGAEVLTAFALWSSSTPLKGFVLIHQGFQRPLSGLYVLVWEIVGGRDGWSAGRNAQTLLKQPQHFNPVSKENIPVLMNGSFCLVYSAL